MRLVSKASKGLASINVFWLAHQVAKEDVATYALPLLALEDTLKPSALTYDIWEQSVVALEDAKGGQKIVIHPLHTLPM